MVVLVPEPLAHMRFETGFRCLVVPTSEWSGHRGVKVTLGDVAEPLSGQDTAV